MRLVHWNFRLAGALVYTPCTHRACKAEFLLLGLRCPVGAGKPRQDTRNPNLDLQGPFGTAGGRKTTSTTPRCVHLGAVPGEQGPHFNISYVRTRGGSTDMPKPCIAVVPLPRNYASGPPPAVRQSVGLRTWPSRIGGWSPSPTSCLLSQNQKREHGRGMA